MVIVYVHPVGMHEETAVEIIETISYSIEIYYRIITVNLRPLLVLFPKKKSLLRSTNISSLINIAYNTCIII
jgi:hypothetical protein